LPEWTFDRKRISVNSNPNRTLKQKNVSRKRNDVIFRASVQIPF